MLFFLYICRKKINYIKFIQQIEYNKKEINNVGANCMFLHKPNDWESKIFRILAL